MLTTVLTKGKQDIYLSCGHRIRNPQGRTRGLVVNAIINCRQCDKGKPIHGKPMRETKTWKENHPS